MKQKFFLNLLFLVGINLLVKPFYIFGIDRTIQNVVGPSSYGVYWALFNFVYLFQVINDLGLQNFTSTFIGQNRNITQKYFGTLAIVKGMASIVFILVVLVGMVLIGYNQWSILLPLMFSQIMVSIIFFLRSTLAGLGYYKTDSVLSILDRLIIIGVMGFLLWGPSGIDVNIHHFVYCQAGSLALTLLVAFFLVNTNVRQWRWNYKPNTIRALLRKSAPFAIGFVLTTLFTRIDSVMIERLLPDGAYQAGIYAGGFRLLDASNMLAYLFAGLLLPMFARVYKDKLQSKELLSSAMGLMWALVFTVSTIMVVYRQEVMDLLYDQSSVTWYEVLRWLMWSYIPMGLSYIAGALLLANDRVFRLNVVYMTAVLMNVILNLYLIPRYGAVGAAKATFITQWTATVCAYYLVFTHLKLYPSLGLILRMLSFASITYFTTKIGQAMTSDFDWRLTFVGFGLLFVAIAVGLRMIPYDLLKGVGKR